MNHTDTTIPTPKRAWPETVKLVRSRALNACERCKKPEGLCIKIYGRWRTIHLDVYHLDHNPQNDDLANLVLLCQDCALPLKAAVQREREARKQRLQDAQLSLDFH